MTDHKEPALKDVEEFLRKNGKQAKLTLSLLGKLNPFIQAMQSPIGREILKDDLDRHEELLQKIYEENSTEQERAEFRYLKSRVKLVSEKIALYVAKSNEVYKK